MSDLSHLAEGLRSLKLHRLAEQLENCASNGRGLTHPPSGR